MAVCEMVSWGRMPAGIDSLVEHHLGARSAQTGGRNCTVFEQADGDGSLFTQMKLIRNETYCLEDEANESPPHL